MSAEELGIDERAAEMLRSLPVDKQNIAMAKLAQGLSAGKVKNASAYIVGVVNGPDLLDIDDRALEMMKELPPNLRKQVVEKLKKANDVRNPSAWIARAVISAKKEQPSMRFGGGGGGGGLAGLDEGATRLLRSLPTQTQQDVLGRLMMQEGVKNPSGWVVKACLAAGASPNTPAAGGGGRGGGVILETLYSDFDPQVSSLLHSGPQGSIVLDSGAQNLLKSLPVETQIELSSQLISQAEIKNPSGWVVKNCIAAGARGNGPPSGGMMGASQVSRPIRSTPGGFWGAGGSPTLDQGATDMLRSLPPATQQNILSKLATANVSNPSAWVVKSCLAAGAATGGSGAAAGASSFGRMGTVANSMFGVMRGGPARLPPEIHVDQNAQQLLQSLPAAEQQDIVTKLTNSFKQGAVQNPSAWVAKAALKAGAKSTPGMGRASPY